MSNLAKCTCGISYEGNFSVGVLPRTIIFIKIHGRDIPNCFPRGDTECTALQQKDALVGTPHLYYSGMIKNARCAMPRPDDTVLVAH